MANEDIIERFPECEKVHKEDIVDCLNSLFDECETYRLICGVVVDEIKKLYPEPEYSFEEGADNSAWKAWDDYVWGSDMRHWIEIVESAFRNRRGFKRTKKEASKIAADLWAEKIFGWHLQDNGAIEEDHPGGFMACALGTVLKNDATKNIPQEVVDNFRKLMSDFYEDDCWYEDEEDGFRGYVTPYCDYGPNSPLYDILKKAGVDEKDIRVICPWKTGIDIDLRDHHVVVRGYQTVKYI